MAVQAYRDFLGRVRDATDMVRLVAEYVPLRKVGRRHSGLCPFHPEKSPSFSVDEEKQLFYCFGCQTGGDVFKFVMLIEKLEFQPAVRMLADRAGIEVPAFQRTDIPVDPERDALLAIYREAASFYRKLLRHPERGKRARQYLKERGLGPATVEALGIGCSPASWDGLRSHLQAKFPARQLVNSGLFVNREDGSSWYDRFRDRLMFPIVSVAGGIVGFGGRMIGQGEPKYLNSPETPIYTKGENLYGLNLSRDAIRKAGEAVVVEGYLDFATLYEAGFCNCVATLGTAFTTSQARLLSRYANRVTVNYDPDTAGLSAARRSVDLLLSRGFTVRVLQLDEGLDPDGFIRRKGAEAYGASLAAAPGYMDFLLADCMRGKDLNDPAARVQALNDVLPHMAQLENPAERSGYYSRIAEALGIEDDVVLEQLKKALKVGKRALPASAMSSSARAGGALAGAAVVSDAEWRLVRSLVESEEARHDVLPGMSEEDLVGLATAEILRALGEMHREEREPTAPALLDRLPDGEPRDLLTRIVFRPEPPGSASEAATCLAALRRDRLVADRRRVQKEIDAAKAKGATVPDELLARKMQLSRRIDDLS